MDAKVIVKHHKRSTPLVSTRLGAEDEDEDDDDDVVVVVVDDDHPAVDDSSGVYSMPTSSASPLLASRKISNSLPEDDFKRSLLTHPDTVDTDVKPIEVKSSDGNNCSSSSPRGFSPLVATSSGVSNKPPAQLHVRNPGVVSSAVSGRLMVVQPGKKATIWTHYYPEGGWGWVVLVCATLVHMLSHGLQLSFGVLMLGVGSKFWDDVEADGGKGKSEPVGHQLALQGWLGAMSLGVSLLISPVTVGLCRRKSTRLTAVLGGLVTALGCLFTSFATQFHQLFFSYGAVIGIGVGLTRDTSTLMVGQYFKRRREFVEIFVVSGSGLGISLMSVFIQEAIGSIGWRLGLQAVTGCMVVTFFVGTFYRSATLYHPQRRAILHLKNQRRKIKDKSGATAVQNPAGAGNNPANQVSGIDTKPPILDFSSLRSKTLQILLIATSLAAFGLSTPIIYLAHHAEEKVAQWTAEAAAMSSSNFPPELSSMTIEEQLQGINPEDPVTTLPIDVQRAFLLLTTAPTTLATSNRNPSSTRLKPGFEATSTNFNLAGPRTPLFLQVFLGLGWAVGTLAFGFIVVQNSTDCRIARLYLCQASVLMCGVSLLALTVVDGYQGYILFVWIYGVFCGGYQYSLKMFTFEKVRARNFPRAWGFVQCSQALPIVIGVPFSGYINVSFGGKAGYYMSAASVLAGGATLFLINIRRRRAAAKVGKRNVASPLSKQQLTPPSARNPSGDNAPWCKQLIAEAAAELSTKSSHSPGKLNLSSRDFERGHVMDTAVGEMLDLDLLDDVETRQALALLRQAAVASSSGSKIVRAAAAHHLASLSALSSLLDIKASGHHQHNKELTCISEEGIADMDLPDNLLDDLDIDLDIDIDLAADCITSCNQMENYLLMSEFEANLNYTGTDQDGENVRQESSCCEGSVASASTAPPESVSSWHSVWPAMRRRRNSIVRQLSALRNRKAAENITKRPAKVVTSSTSFEVKASTPEASMAEGRPPTPKPPDAQKPDSCSSAPKMKSFTKPPVRKKFPAGCSTRAEVRLLQPSNDANISKR
ncbi:unnamed protein product [Notodromas monacha]|uniref:Monocarboxylate transporter n=1 Tax=Notodromas monacha TaxID=399045 RepID=A0A7R9BR97_9CRUS|nr:unnamed protein product [Notodromas monacha]CAG0920204.1 unnamed protein product [Notodromas monacha]